MAGTSKNVTVRREAEPHRPVVVVDHRLRVKGVEGLWVADASIIPSIPAGNINATCIMIGERAADMIREDTQHRSKAA